MITYPETYAVAIVPEKHETHATLMRAAVALSVHGRNFVFDDCILLHLVFLTFLLDHHVTVTNRVSNKCSTSCITAPPGMDFLA